MSTRPTFLTALLTLIQACLLGMLLAACGGGQSTDAGSGPRVAAATVQAAALPADYAQSVQQLYVAYFGRPADPGGLANFEAALQAAGAPTDIQAFDSAYSNSAAIRALVDAFGVSTESQGLYTGDTTAFVQAIYQHVLNRAPLPTGLAYWVDSIDHGGLQRGNAALSIMAAALANGSAQGQLDAALIANKIAVASNFTAVVPVTTYRGQTIAAMARAMLATVTGSTSVSAFQATITSTISAMQAANVKSYAGNYSGSYGGADAGVFSFTIADNGAVNGSGHSTAFGYDLMIVGSIAEGGAVSLTAQGTAGAATYVGTLNASTGALSGTWNAGIYGSGTFSGQRY
ncbi:MAG TPA: DUF4214 domain-containing protein [Burkholderiaceae bacterium]|nr:DUF4214 domain-containing protein [Burkholderiaceae bacterium]